MAATENHAVHGRASNQALRVASLVAFGAALALSVPVLERLIAAMWQWYKFIGFQADGHIMLSLRTGKVFSGLLIVVMGLALCCNRLAQRQGDQSASFWSLLAVCLAILDLLAYWILGMSSLNVWRA